MESKELEIVARAPQPANLMQYAMAIEQVVQQREMIKQVMKEIMKENQHYGTIPGTEKPTLYLPGAETLATVFRFAPSFVIEEKSLPNGHLQVRATCRLTHIPTGAMLAEISGSCSTMEAKYRFRDADAVPTGNPVPREYWDLKKEGKDKEALELIGGKGFKPLKTDDGWMIARKTGQKVENPNPEDLHNTALKMAEKRAFVAAVRIATGATDIFTITEEGPDADEKHREQVASRNRRRNENVLSTEDLEAKLAELTTPEEAAAFFNSCPQAQWKNRAHMKMYTERMVQLREASKPKQVRCEATDAMVPAERCESCGDRQGCPSHG